MILGNCQFQKSETEKVGVTAVSHGVQDMKLVEKYCMKKPDSSEPLTDDDKIKRRISDK